MPEFGAWTALFETLDADILRDPIAGETTGVALAISPTAIVGASCGDSQAWRVTANGSEELTGDQPRKIRLGTGRVQARGFCAGAAGTLIVGTDGLFDFARWDDIAATVRSGSENLAHALVELVRARYHRLPDDLAVVVGELK